MKRIAPRVTGSLQEKDGRLYIVVQIPDAAGKLHQKWISTGLPAAGNKRRAKKMLDEKLLELQAEYERTHRMAGWATDEVGEQPFLDVANRWMARKRPTLAPATIEGYEKILARLTAYFRPLALAVKEISPQILEAYCASLMREGLSANTVRHHLTLIKSVFNDEIKNGAPLLNPVKCVKAPKMETFEAKTYSIEEIMKLFELFAGDELDDIVMIAVLYGLRRSEICGLRWCDVDFGNNLIHIRHKISEVRIAGKHQVIRSNALKTEASRRSFPLTPAYRERLLKRRAWIAENVANNASYQSGDAEYVFVHADGRLITPNFVTDHFRAKIKASGLPPLRFHDLRHTCATLLLQEGCSLREIQAYLGHATYTTTMRYAHMEGRSKQNALDKLDSALLRKIE